MKNLFFKHFGIENSNVISVSGDGDNTALIHLLAKESVEAGFRTLVVGICEQKYPVEGKVFFDYTCAKGDCGKRDFESHRVIRKSHG